MSNLFIISDTHFWHRNILKFQPKERPFANIEEHDEVLVENWNVRVRPQDTVWHLGDVAMHIKGLDILRRLNGTKKLVMGNHDIYPIEAYQEHFVSVKACREWQGILFTHIPVHPTQLRRWKGNVHGHTHSGTVKTPVKRDEGLAMDDDPRYFPASVEHTGLAPVPIEEIKNYFNLLEHAVTGTPKTLA